MIKKYSKKIEWQLYNIDIQGLWVTESGDKDQTGPLRNYIFKICAVCTLNIASTTLKIMSLTCFKVANMYVQVAS